MKFLHRLMVYVLVTAIIEASTGIVLYYLGFPSNSAISGSLAGQMAFLIFFNFILWMVLSNAIGGPEGAAPQGSWIYDPIARMVGGIVGMFIIVTAIGESMNWVGERIVEKAGWNEPRRFKRQLDSAIHDFMGVTYSSEQAQMAAETRLNELYSEHPEQVMAHLSETLTRVKKMGTKKDAEQLETLVKKLQDKAKN